MDQYRLPEPGSVNSLTPIYLHTTELGSAEVNYDNTHTSLCYDLYKQLESFTGVLRGVLVYT